MTPIFTLVYLTVDSQHSDGAVFPMSTRAALQDSSLRSIDSTKSSPGSIASMSMNTRSLPRSRASRSNRRPAYGELSSRDS